MRKEEVKNYTITTDGQSGLEFELHLMPQFFNSAVCLEQSHTHTYYQIIWFRRGYGIHQVDLVDYPVDDNTLSHYVAQSAHLTPLQVINDRVVLEAKRQLQHSTLSIKEIGYQLGFEDPSYFVKFFKRMTGQMPKEFRKDCEVQQRLSASVSSSKITNIMKQKIGIPTADGKLFPHFGKAPHVTVFDVEDEKILNKEVLTAPEHAHGAMPKFLQGLGVTDVICGGLGAGAIQLLEQMAIRIHGGAPADDVDAVVDAYLKGTLVLGDRTCHHDGCGGDHHHHH